MAENFETKLFKKLKDKERIFFVNKTITHQRFSILSKILDSYESNAKDVM